MISKHRLKALARKAFSPMTIMFIPHSHTSRAINVHLPLIVVACVLVLSGVGSVYVASMIANAVRYQAMDRQIQDYSKHVEDFQATLQYLKKTEQDLRQILSGGTREKVLQKVDTAADMGTFEIDSVQKQIEISMRTVESIKEYLKAEKDLFVATPRGWPIQGPMTSPFGSRINPISRRVEFHRGVDISAAGGTSVRATADGVVSFAGWSNGGGNMVSIAHGEGFATYYAHNRQNLVAVGQRVKRGDIIALVGATGWATGNHVHYEVWRNGQVLNPRSYLDGRS